MTQSEDNTSETVSRYIQELLERRADVPQACVSSTAARTETDLICRVPTEDFREEMVSRFERLRELAKEAAPRPVEVPISERRVRLGWILLVVALMASPVLCSLAWTALGAASHDGRPVQVFHGSSDTGDQHRESSMEGRNVQEDVSSNAATKQPVSAQPDGVGGASARSARPSWSTVTKHAMAPTDVVNNLMKQRARLRIARMLTDAVNDQILGFPAAARVVRIELRPGATRWGLAHDYVGDVVDASGQMVGQVSGTYASHPESLSASVRYEDGDPVEYSRSYFDGRF